MTATSTETSLVIGGMEMKFLATDAETNGSLMVFEITVPAGCHVPPAHYHVEVEEVVVGLEGVLTFTAGGETRELRPGERVVVPRGVEHRFENLHDVPSRALVVQSPGKIGPGYYREIAAMVNAGGPPDPARAKAIMARYGLVAVPPKG